MLVKLWLNQDLKIDVLGAIQMLKAVWENVKQETRNYRTLLSA